VRNYLQAGTAWRGLQTFTNELDVWLYDTVARIVAAYIYTCAV